MSKKKILYIHHGKGLGGAPLSLLYLIKALDKTIYHPVVLFLHQSEIIDLYKKNNIDIIGPANVYDFSHTKIWWFKWYHFPYLLRAIKDTIKTIFFIAPKIFDVIKPDLVHLNTSSLIGWGYVAHKKKIPVVWHIREPLAAGYFGLRRWIIKTCVNKYASKIVPICKNDAKPWLRSQKTQVVYNAACIKKFNYNLSPDNFLKQHNLDQHMPKILYLGGLSREKGTHVIIKSFLKLQEKLPEAVLLIAGHFNTGSWWSPKNLLPGGRYRRSVAKLINNNIKLLGTINNVPEAMAASSLVVFSATVGHFARPIIEAGLMAKPVIASYLEPLNELVVHNQTGFLLDPNNHELWAAKLHLLLTDKQLNKQMGHAAYKFSISRFTIETQIEKIKKIYEATLDKTNNTFTPARAQVFEKINKSRRRER